MSEESNNERVRQLLSGLTRYKPERTTLNAQMFADQDGGWFSAPAVESLLVKVLPKDEGSSKDVMQFLREITESGKDMNGAYWIPRAKKLLESIAAQPVAASAAGLHDLRTAVQQMARALRDGEWADLLTMDPDAAELEKQIEHLLATQSAKQGAQAAMSQRQSFEHWFSDEGKHLRAVERSGDGYALLSAQSAWEAWKAAYKTLDVTGRPSGPPTSAAQVAQERAPVAEVRDQALEEAAEQCKPGLIANATAYEIAAIQKCANAIRALKSTTNKSEG